MKVNELITQIYQATGLWFINRIANSVPCDVSENLSYGELARQSLDHYRLADHEQKPTVVFFYGGNWRSGRKQDYRFVADTLMSMGFNVVIPDYRLYPLVRYRDILNDAISAVRYVATQLTSQQPLYIVGHSAGAQLGALLTLNEALLDASIRQRISGFVGLAGPYDFYPFTEDDHWDLFAPTEHYEAAQAVNHVRSDAAPLYLLHGADDRRVRRGHSKSLMEKQLAAGGLATREVYENLGHVEILLAFTRLHRSKSKVVQDIHQFLKQAAQNNTNDNGLKEAFHGT